MAVTFTPVYSQKISGNGGSALLVKGTITTTANDAVSASSLGFTQILEFIGVVRDGADAFFMAKVANSNIANPTGDISLCPLDNAHAYFPFTDNWPSNDYEVTFIAL